MLTCAPKTHFKKINVETIYSTCGVFNSLNIKFFILLNTIFLFLSTLTCVIRTQINMTLSYEGNPFPLLLQNPRVIKHESKTERKQ
jgi:hypothetical protein